MKHWSFKVNQLFSRLNKPQVLKKNDFNRLNAKIHFHFQVVDDGGRPKIQVEHKGETKTFFAEEVFDPCVFLKMKGKL